MTAPDVVQINWQCEEWPIEPQILTFHLNVSPPSIVNIFWLLTHVPVASVIKDKIHVCTSSIDQTWPMHVPETCSFGNASTCGAMVREVDGWTMEIGIGWLEGMGEFSDDNLDVLLEADVRTHVWSLVLGRWHIFLNYSLRRTRQMIHTCMSACLRAIYRSAGMCFRRRGGIAPYVSIYT